jgi:signal transduction histidine kinase
MQKGRFFKGRARTAFLWLAGGGLLLNVLFDFTSYRKIDASDASGLAVARSYERMIHLLRLDRLLEHAQKDLGQKELYDRIFGEIRAVKGLSIQGSTAMKDAETLENILVPPTAQSGAEAAALCAKMLSTESRILEGELSADKSENSKLRHSMLRALLVDYILIASLLTLFLLDHFARNRLEKSLATSVRNLREINLALKQREAAAELSNRELAHGLKNPLGSIRGFAELIRMEAQAHPSIQEYSDTIGHASETTLQLVDSLLSTTGKNRLKMVQIDFMDVLDEICAQAEVLARAKGQELIRQSSISSATVFGNRMKLEELVFNILGNAIKYSPPNTKIWIRCRGENGRVQVEIEDQGPGFSAEDKGRAFQAGQILSARPTGNETSSGYGLFISKQIVDLHKGRIMIYDGHKRGACIRFELPEVSREHRPNFVDMGSEIL